MLESTIYMGRLEAPVPRPLPEQSDFNATFSSTSLVASLPFREIFPEERTVQKTPEETMSVSSNLPHFCMQEHVIHLGKFASSRIFPEQNRFQLQSVQPPLTPSLPFRAPYLQEVSKSDKAVETTGPKSPTTPTAGAQKSVKLGRHMRALKDWERLSRAPTVEERERGSRLRQQMQQEQHRQRQEAERLQQQRHARNQQLLQQALLQQRRAHAQRQSVQSQRDNAFQFPAVVEQQLFRSHSRLP